MKIIRHTEDELVVRDGSLVRIAIGIAAYSFLFYFVNMFGLSRWWSIVLCLVIAVVIFSTTTITTFTFDAQRKTVNWRTGLLFNLSSRTIPFADIRDICVDGYFLFGTVRYRLSVRCFVNTVDSLPPFQIILRSRCLLQQVPEAHTFLKGISA